jgi:hypothetical protein
MTLTATVDDVLGWDPCEDYDEARIRELAEGLPERFGALDLADHLRGRIPDADLMWLLCHEELVSARMLRECACDWAERACQLAGGADSRSLAAIEVARRHARGEATDDELDAAWAAAWAAARAAAWAAAWAAAGAAARDALEPTVAELQDSALELLDRMIAVGVDQ